MKQKIKLTKRERKQIIDAIIWYLMGVFLESGGYDIFFEEFDKDQLELFNTEFKKIRNKYENDLIIYSKFPDMLRHIIKEKENEK